MILISILKIISSIMILNKNNLKLILFKKLKINGFKINKIKLCINVLKII